VEAAERSTDAAAAAAADDDDDGGACVTTFRPVYIIVFIMPSCPRHKAPRLFP